VEPWQLGKEVGTAEPDEKDLQLIENYVDQYVAYFGYDKNDILNRRFIKLYPRFLRPYGALYAS